MIRPFIHISLHQWPLFAPPLACGFRSSSYASYLLGRATSGYVQRVTGMFPHKMGTSWPGRLSLTFSDWDMSSDGNRLCQQGMQRGVFTSRDISMHPRVRTQQGTSPLTTARPMVTEILWASFFHVSTPNPFILTPCNTAFYPFFHVCFRVLTKFLISGYRNVRCHR